MNKGQNFLLCGIENKRNKVGSIVEKLQLGIKKTQNAFKGIKQ